MDPKRPLRIGILGTDTSHVTGFAKLLNSNNPSSEIFNARITDAVPSFSNDIPSSISRHEDFSRALVEEHGVTLHSSIDSMARHVDAFIIHSIDGRQHRSQLGCLLPFKKPVFVDKPFASSLADATAMFADAERASVPVFSSSLYRFHPSLRNLLQQDVGRILHAQSVGPCYIEPSHPDLFWYGIHPAEALFTVLGPHCRSVTRTRSADVDVVTGVWKNGAIGTLIGLRAGPIPHGVVIHGENGTLTQQATASSTAFGAPEDYAPLVIEILSFFRTGSPPVAPRETLSLLAFLEAAELSKTSGATVHL